MKRLRLSQKKKKREKKTTRKENKDVIETSLVKITIELSQEDVLIDATKYFSGKLNSRTGGSK
jgi:hypothetical protein